MRKGNSTGFVDCVLKAVWAPVKESRWDQKMPSEDCLIIPIGKKSKLFPEKKMLEGVIWVTSQEGSLFPQRPSVEQ